MTVIGLLGAKMGEHPITISCMLKKAKGVHHNYFKDGGEQS